MISLRRQDDICLTFKTAAVWTADSRDVRRALVVPVGWNVTSVRHLALGKLLETFCSFLLWLAGSACLFVLFMLPLFVVESPRPRHSQHTGAFTVAVRARQEALLFVSLAVTPTCFVQSCVRLMSVLI